MFVLTETLFNRCHRGIDDFLGSTIMTLSAIAAAMGVEVVTCVQRPFVISEKSVTFS